MEQLDFLLIFTMDVKTYSCAIWYNSCLKNLS